MEVRCEINKNIVLLPTATPASPTASEIQAWSRNHSKSNAYIISLLTSGSSKRNPWVSDTKKSLNVGIICILGLD